MKTSILILATFASLLSSCAKEDNSYSDDNSPVLLQVGGAVIDDVNVSVTRAVTSQPYPTDRELGFYLKAGNGYSAYNNIKGSYNATRTLWEPAKNIWLISKEADLLVYGPYDAGMPADCSITLTAGRFDKIPQKEKEYVYSRFKAKNTTANPTVSLGHVVSRMVVTVSRTAGYNIDAVLNTLRLSGNEIYPGATFSPLNDSPYVYPTKSTLDITPDASITLSDAVPTATYDIMLVPATLSGDITVELSVNGEKMRATLPKGRFGSSKLEPGKQYNVNLKLKAGRLEVSSVSVVKWGAEPVVEGGNGEFDGENIIGIHVPFADINLGGSACTAADKTLLSSLRWAESNLKSAGTDSSVKDYVWGDSHEDYGYYYTWNSSYMGEGNTGSNGTDPCSLLSPAEYGIGWRTPSKAEFDALSRCTDKQLVTYNGKNGMWFMNNTSGLFLPAAGYRGSDGSGLTAPYNAGTRGFYWSREAVSSNYGSYLTFYSGNASTIGSFKTHGKSVRCVRDK